ncbi:hypothetical protein BC835DRAFT_433500 [Cytidiella melzeri]|nr:hypothetical protein BC835DRAFT_433500 [Cytidiella melzeri]
MLGHASRRVDHSPLISILQAAACRAWVRTRPVAQAFYRTSTRAQTSSGFGTLYEGENSTSRPLRNSSSASASHIPAAAHDLNCSNSDRSDCFEPLRPSTQSDGDVYLEQDGASCSSAGIPHSSNAAPAHLSVADVGSIPDLVTGELPIEPVGWETVPAAQLARAHDTASPLDETAHTNGHVEEVGPLLDLTALRKDRKTLEHFVDASTASTEEWTDMVYDGEDPTLDCGLEVPARLPTTSATSLYENLISLSSIPLPPSANKIDKLNDLLGFHWRHRAFHSTRSYNLIISLSIAIREFSIAKELLNEMRSRGIPHNLETRQLHVRFWLRQGKWTEVWLQETAAGKRSLPLPIWIEFFQTIRIFEPLRKDATMEERDMRRQGCSTALSSRRRLLMRYRPSLTDPEEATMPPRAMFYFIRRMLQSGRHKEAFDLTSTYLQRLPRTLEASYRKYCVDIMNLHLKAKAKDVRELRPKLQKLLALHPDLRPDAETLWLVLGAIRTEPGNSVVLDRIKRRFQKQWGEDIADERVLSFVADRARRDRYHRIMKNVIQEYDRRRETCAPHAWLPSSFRPPSTGFRWPHKVVFYNQDKEDARWKFYRESLRTLVSKRGSRKKPRSGNMGS